MFFTEGDMFLNEMFKYIFSNISLILFLRNLEKMELPDKNLIFPQLLIRKSFKTYRNFELNNEHPNSHNLGSTIRM